MVKEDNSIDEAGLRLSYDRIKNVPYTQLSIAQELAGKASILWAAATATIGIAVPIGLGDEVVKSQGATWPLFVAVVAYVAVTILSLTVTFPGRHIELVDHPGHIRDHYWNASEQQFLRDMSLNIEKGFQINIQVLNRYGWTVRWVHIALLAQVLFISAWIGLPHWNVTW